jgi:hypothetical protein
MALRERKLAKKKTRQPESLVRNGIFCLETISFRLAQE